MAFSGALRAFAAGAAEPLTWVGRPTSFGEADTQTRGHSAHTLNCGLWSVSPLPQVRLMAGKLLQGSDQSLATAVALVVDPQPLKRCFEDLLDGSRFWEVRLFDFLLLELSCAGGWMVERNIGKVCF